MIDADMYLFDPTGRILAIVYSLFLFWQRLRQKPLSLCV